MDVGLGLSLLGENLTVLNKAVCPEAKSLRDVLGISESCCHSGVGQLQSGRPGYIVT